MPKVSQLAFNAGELTEFMDPRVDTAKYSKGCRKLENFQPLPYGTILSRPGTVHAGPTKHADRKARLFPFNFAKTAELIEIEVGHEYFRFWLDREQVMDGGSPYEISSIYDEAHLFELQFEQQNDFVYIVHPLYPEHRLIREANDDWTFERVDYTSDYNYPPLAPRNADAAKTLAIGAGYDTKGSSVALTASVATFTADDIGHLYKITHRRSDVLQKSEFSGAGLSATDPFYVLGDWIFETGGNGVYDVTLEESVDKVTWIDKRTYSIDGVSRNERATGTETTPKFFRVSTGSVTSPGTGATAPFVVIETSNANVPGLVKITAVTDSTNATGTVIEPFFSGDASDDWEEEYFSKKRGYPRAICFHKDRRCIASDDVWISQPGNYENYRTRNDADSGFMVPVRRNGSPQVQWMESLRELRVGTNQAEGVIIQENTTEAFGYNNYDLRWDTNFGSKYLRAQPVNGTMMFLQQEGRTLRNQVITGIEDYYDSDSLTMLADHILEDGATQTAFQRQRYSTYHATRSDGQLASMLYEERQNVQAWYRTVTDGEIESISVNPRADEEDQVAMIVKRTVDGATVRHLEYVALGQYRILQRREKEEMWYVDDGIRIEGTDMTSLSGLDHLEGVEVAILCDGAAIARRTVVGGSVDLDYETNIAIVGRPYDYPVIPMFLESQQVMGQSKRITAVIARLWRSGLFKARVGTGPWSTFAIPADEYGDAPDLYDGDSAKVLVEGEWSRNTTVELVGCSPLPLNIEAITLEFEVGKH